MATIKLIDYKPAGSTVLLVFLITDGEKTFTTEWDIRHLADLKDNGLTGNLKIKWKLKRKE